MSVIENSVILEPEVRIPFFILLHMLGQNENDLLFLKEKLPKNSLILSIRAPRDWLGDDSYSWFDITGSYLENWSKIDDIQMCSDYIKSIIDSTIQKYPLLDDPIFIGVSQGAVVSLYMCVENKIKCKAVVSLLGFYEFRLDTGQNIDTPILMINSNVDDIIPPDWVEKSHSHLKMKCEKVTGIFLNSDHCLNNEMVDLSICWIKNLIEYV